MDKVAVQIANKSAAHVISDLGPNALYAISSNELVRIVSLPDADENDWVVACHELERRGINPIPPDERLRSRRIAVVGMSAVFVTASLCIIGAIAYTSFSAPQKLPPITVVNNLPAPPLVHTDVDYGPYMADVQRRIKSQWRPPYGKKFAHVRVAFKIASNGTASDATILVRSISQAQNDAAIEAVKLTRFRPLPAGAPDNVDIQFSFWYGADGQSYPWTQTEGDPFNRVSTGEP